MRKTKLKKLDIIRHLSKLHKPLRCQSRRLRFRRIATRYAKMTGGYLAMVIIARILEWV